MGRTTRNRPGAQKGTGATDSSAARRSQISHALSRLLRHQAENEKVPITPAGWVNLQDLLAWRGLDRIGKGIDTSEIFQVVEEDGRTGKGRFSVQRIGTDNKEPTSDQSLGEGVAKQDEAGSIGANDAAPEDNNDTIAQFTRVSIDSESKNTPETQSAIHYHESHPEDLPSNYQIRAAQGHSIKSVQSTELLIPITLDDPATIPETVVHGTFYGAWPSILATGGLKSMGRNNVHFATGPSIDIVSELVGEDRRAMGKKGQVDEVLSKNKVISGMRWDAQLLIYIDIRKCLEDVAARGLDMTWWRSGNGVILTEGVIPPQDDQTHSQEGSHSEAQAPVLQEDTDQAALASATVKARKNQENLQTRQAEQQQQTSDNTTFLEENIDEPILASANAKAKKHNENMEAAKQRQQQQQSQRLAQEAASMPEEIDQAIVASSYAKAGRANENLQAATAGAATTTDTNNSTTSQSQPQFQSHSNPPQKAKPHQHQRQRIVPMKYWTSVIEIKNGLGVIWKQGDGLVQELPERLRSMPLPQGKRREHGGERGRGGGGRGVRGGRGKPTLHVERDGVEAEAGGED